MKIYIKFNTKLIWFEVVAESNLIERVWMLI